MRCGIELPMVVLWFCGMAGCGGPAVVTNDIYAHSQPKLVVPAELPEHSGLNVKVLTVAPTGPYMVLATWDTSFDYQLGSVTYHRIEKKKHLAELRERAGRLGANTIVVKFMDHPHPTGGVAMRNDSDEITELVHTDGMSREFVRTFAVYRK